MDSISLNFQNAGFDGPLVIHNLRMMFYVFLLHIVALFLMILLILCAKKSQKIKKVKDKASSYLFWNGTIRFLLANYLDFCMFSFINLHYVDWRGQFTILTICNYTSIALSSIVCIFPIFALIFYSIKIASWSDEEFNDKYGELMADLNLTKSEAKWTILIFPLSFMLRRLTLCLVIIFWPEFLWGQLAMMMMTSQGLIMYIQWFRPFESNFVMAVETFNEMTNLFTLYLMMAFSDAEPNVEARNSIYGNLFIAVIIVYLTFHGSLLIVDVCL